MHRKKKQRKVYGGRRGFSEALARPMASLSPERGLTEGKEGAACRFASLHVHQDSTAYVLAGHDISQEWTTL